MLKPYDFIKDAERVNALCKKALAGSELKVTNFLNKNVQAKAKKADVKIQ